MCKRSDGRILQFCRILSGAKVSGRMTNVLEAPRTFTNTRGLDTVIDQSLRNSHRTTFKCRSHCQRVGSSWVRTPGSLAHDCRAMTNND